MMSHEEIKEKLVAEVGRRLDADVSFTVMGGNNEVMVFTPRNIAGVRAMPVVSLNACYELYEQTGDFERVVSTIAYAADNSGQVLGIDPADILVWDKVKDRICFKLMRKEGNQDYLNANLYTDYLDLALAAIILLPADERTGQNKSISVNNAYLENWHVTKKEVLARAAENSPRLMKPKVINMNDLLNEIPNFPVRKEASALNIVTNSGRFLGAVVITFPGVLERLAREANSDLYIIPSSTHEVIVWPVKSTDDSAEVVSGYIRSVNADIVAPGDVLSDHCYIYKRKTGRRKTAAIVW